MTAQPSVKRPVCSLHTDVRLLNHREEVHLQRKIHSISAKYRLNVRLLEQERASVLMEHRRLLNLKVCEPHATVNHTMRAISAARMTSDAPDSRTAKSAPDFRATTSAKHPGDQNRSFAKSATFSGRQDDAPLRMLSPGKLNASESGQLSILQLKDLALIDSISQKELMHQAEYYRLYIERLKQLQREKLRQKIKSFLETIEHV